MKVRLTRKLAETLDGIDVSKAKAGDVLELTRNEAELLVAEGWAEQLNRPGRNAARGPVTTNKVVVEHLKRLPEELGPGRLVEQDHRRAEDRFRDELRDSRARTIGGSD